MTPAGQQAYDIMEWAWQDPESRVDQAIQRVRELASQNTGDALREIQDSGTMLSRLQGSLQPVTITDQLTAGTILSQIITLARDPAWMHERRGPHGEWMGAGGATHIATTGRKAQARHDRMREAQMRRIAREEAQRAQREAAGPAKEVAEAATSPRMQAADAAARAAIPEDISADEVQRRLKAMPLIKGEDPQMHMNPLPGESPRENLLHEQLFHQRVVPMTESRAAAVLAQAKQVVEAKADEINKAADTEEGHKAMLKAAIEGSIAVIAAILAITVGGIPIAIALGTTFAPVLAQVALEFWKRL